MSPVKSVSRQLSTAFEEQIYPTFGGPPTADLNIFVVVNRVFTVHPSPRFILVILAGNSRWKMLGGTCSKCKNLGEFSNYTLCEFLQFLRKI